ncbi:MAG: Spy/CpxP family protein refolding chaperone [Desulfuromonadales bacterium]
MIRILYTAVLVSFFMGATVLTGLAASEHESHHPAGAKAAASTSSAGTMMQQGAGMNQMPCMASPHSGSRTQMMGMMGKEMGDMMGSGMSGMMGGDGMHGMMHGGQMGMMEQGMEHMLYLDRADELGLSAEQVGRLKAIHVECRKDNIRNAAEAKIARLELSELLSGDNWTLKDAESLVRKVQTLEGDIQVRHLQAVRDARKVLTAEQLKQAHADDGAGNLESLFQ